MFTAAELESLRYLVSVAAQFIPANHSSRPHAQTMAARVRDELAVSRERSESDCAAPELDRDQIVGTSEAARVLGCSQRRVQQRIAAGDLAAELVGRTYLLRKVNLTDGQETQHR